MLVGCGVEDGVGVMAVEDPHDAAGVSQVGDDGDKRDRLEELGNSAIEKVGRTDSRLPAPRQLLSLPRVAGLQRRFEWRVQKSPITTQSVQEMRRDSP